MLWKIIKWGLIIIFGFNIIGLILDKLGIIDIEEDSPKETEKRELTPEEKKEMQKQLFLNKLDTNPEFAMFALGEEFENSYASKNGNLKVVVDGNNFPVVFDAASLNNKYLNNAIKFKKEYLNRIIVVKDKITKMDYIDGTIVISIGDGMLHWIEAQDHLEEMTIYIRNDYPDKDYEELLSSLRMGEEIYVIGILPDGEQDRKYTLREAVLFGYQGKTLKFAKKKAIEGYDKYSNEIRI